MLNGSAVAAGALGVMVDFVSDAYPIVIPFAGIGLFGIVALLVRRMGDS